MAFDPSYSEILKNQKEALKQLDQLLKVAEAKMVASATDISSKMLRAIVRDPTTKAMIDKFTSFAGFKGKAAGKEFARQFNAQTASTISSTSKVAAIAANLDKRAIALSERMTKGFGNAARVANLVKQAKEDIAAQLKLNDRLLYTMQHQLQKPGLSAASKKEIKEAIARLKGVNHELKLIRDNSDGLAASTRRIEILEKLQGFKERMMAPIEKARDMGGFAVDAAKMMIENPKLLMSMIGAAIVGMIMLMINQFFAAAKVFRDAGQTGKQLWESTQKAAGISGAMLKHGFLMDAKEAAEQIEAMQTVMGQLSIPDKVTEQAAYLNRMFKMSAEASAEISGMLFRFGGRDENAAIKSIKYVEAFARKNGLNAKQIYADMAQHGEDLAKSGNMVAESLAKAAVDSKRVGYNMSSMTGLADRLVGDFEGALKTQAQLQTMFPGADMSEVMYASQFGTNEQLGDAVKSMVQGIGMEFKSMPRSFKLALQQATGMSATELANIVGSKDLSKLAEPSGDPTVDGITQAFDLSEGGVGTIIKLLKVIAFSPLIGGMGNFFKFNKANPADNWHKQAWGFHTGGIVGINGVPRFHDGLMPNEIPAILQKGEAVLTANMLSGLSGIVGNIMSIRDTMSGANVSSGVAVGDSSNLESLLRELIVATKQQKTIQMDAKKVGEVLVSAHRGL
jgi:hypothetical protein